MGQRKSGLITQVTS